MKSKHVYHKFSGVYFAQFFALGSFLPLFAIYLKSIGMTGKQIGNITAIGSFITVFAPPIIGYVADKFHIHKKTHMALLAISAFSAAFIPTTNHYILILLIMVFFNAGLSGINPLLDSIALHVNIPFGKIRLWGAIGFGAASGLVGFLADLVGLKLIFIIYSIVALIAIVIMSRIDVHLGKTKSMSSKDLLSLLTNKTFLIFLVYCFLVASTVNGQNIYFGLLFEEIGGNITLLGITFLLFTFSEAPFMHFGANYIQRSDVNVTLLIAPIVLSLRWFYYGFFGSSTMIMVLFFIQGFTYIFFLLGSAEYIKRNVDQNLRSTAMALFTSFGFGLGGLFGNLLSGNIYDAFSARAIYVSYGIICLVAFFVAIPLLYMKMDRK